MKIGVILPVYNVEKRLQICLDSIFNQTYKNFIIIAVNDGSTDTSLSVLNKIKDKRLRIINQKNKGLSRARNRGLKEILKDDSIDIITFIDSDDRIKEDYFEHASNAFSENETDCYFSGYFEETKKTIKKFQLKTYGICNKKDIFVSLCNGTIPVTVCGKFFKKEICNNLKYPDFNPGEDFCGNAQLLLRTNKNVFVDNYCGYFYYRDSDQPSITRSKRDFRKRINCVYANKFVYELLQDNTIRKIMKNKIVDSFFHEMPYFICSKLNREEKLELKRFKKWAKNEFIFKSVKNRNLFLYKFLRPVYIATIKLKYSKYYR